MKDSKVEVSAKKVYRQKLISRLVRIIFLLLLVLVSILYLALYIVYDGGRFTVTLDKNLQSQKNVFLSETGDKKSEVRKLSADTIDYMDNISIKWLPDDIDTEATGAHNGDNYIAYTFYVYNSGIETLDYSMKFEIENTSKNLDEVVRVRFYVNDVMKPLQPSTTSFQVASKSPVYQGSATSAGREV